MESIDYIAEAITDALGERCEEYSEGCPTCEAWKQYDDLKGRAASQAIVKPLEWEDVEFLDEPTKGPGAQAVGPFGAWYFVHPHKGGWRIHFSAKEAYPTLEAAKSAAQADYSARIMSAIEPAGVKSWGEMQAEDCVLSIGSKRTCGHGTLGCVNHHAPPLPIEPAGVGVETLANEPVAWADFDGGRYRDPDLPRFITSDRDAAEYWKRHGRTVVPLYTRASLKGDEQ